MASEAEVILGKSLQSRDGSTFPRFDLGHFFSNGLGAEWGERCDLTLTATGNVQALADMQADEMHSPSPTPNHSNLTYHWQVAVLWTVC